MVAKKIVKKVLHLLGIQRKPTLFDIKGWYFYLLDSLHNTKVSILLVYSGATIFGFSMVAMNIFTFVVCISVIYPHFQLSEIGNTQQFVYQASTSESGSISPTQEAFTGNIVEEKVPLHTEESFSPISYLEKVFQKTPEVPLNAARNIPENNKPIIPPEVKKTGIEYFVPKKPQQLPKDEKIEEKLKDSEKKEIEKKAPEKKEQNILDVIPKDTLAKTLHTEIEKQLSSFKGDIFYKFSKKVLKSDNMFLENGVWYTYVYPNYQTFGKGVTPSSTDIVSGGLKYDTTVLMLDSNLGALFLTKYEKVKLVKDEILTNVANKRAFLRELVEDKKYSQNDTDESFIQLKKTTQELTSGLSDSKKIAKIYNFVLSNVSYTSNFDTANKKLSSGIETYRSKVGACAGYSKMFAYMLGFAGIGDVNVIRGHVIDASDFPNIGHAWVRVGKFYYDPTFDDPVGRKATKTASEYKYFALPKDIFYSNRFNVGELPASLKNGSLSARKAYIQEKLFALSEKYDASKYSLLSGVSFKKKLGLTAKEELTLETLKSLVPTYEVYDGNKVLEGTKEKSIQDIQFYTVTNANIETLLQQLKFNLEGYFLFHYEDGSYKLAYKVTFS